MLTKSIGQLGFGSGQYDSYSILWNQFYCACTWYYPGTFWKKLAPKLKILSKEFLHLNIKAKK